MGSTLSAVGVAVFVYLETGSEAWLGVLAGAAGLPVVLVSPFLGLLDGYRRRTMMLIGDVTAAIGPFVALLLALSGRLELWQLALAGFVGGIGTAIQTPAGMAAVPALVDRESLDRANGLAQLGPAAGIVAGPMLATPLVAWWGIEAVLAVDFATFKIGRAHV